MHGLPNFVILLATLGLVVSLGILVNPLGLENIGERAQVSSAVSTLFALTAGIIAIAAAQWFGSSDFKAQEAVKADIARVLASLRSIMVKTAVMTQVDQSRETGLDFDAERKILNNFLSSTTAFAFWSWVAERDESTGAGTPEAWRLFFFTITQLLETNQRGRLIALDVDRAELVSNVQETDLVKTRMSPRRADIGRTISDLRARDEAERAMMVAYAASLEVLLTSLHPGDVRAIGRNLVDLPEAIARFKDTSRLPEIHAYVKQSPFSKGLAHPTRIMKPIKLNGEDQMSSQGDLNLRKFQHIKSKGINDPNVDMFIAVLEPGAETPERLDRLRTALAAGADRSMTDAVLLARYAAELTDFDG
jgi:hypothetical protein